MWKHKNIDNANIDALMRFIILTLIKIFLYNKELLRKLMKIKTCCLSKINLMKKEKK